MRAWPLKTLVNSGFIYLKKSRLALVWYDHTGKFDLIGTSHIASFILILHECFQGVQKETVARNGLKQITYDKTVKTYDGVHLL